MKMKLRTFFFMAILGFAFVPEVIAASNTSKATIILWAGDTSVKSKTIIAQQGEAAVECFNTSEISMKYQMYGVKNGRDQILVFDTLKPGESDVVQTPNQDKSIPMYIKLKKSNIIAIKFATGKAIIRDVN